MPEVTKSGETTAVRRRVYFLAVDTVDLKTRLAASDMSSFTVKISKDGGGATTPATATITEVDSTNMKGLFYWDGAVADWQSCSKLILKVSNTGGAKTMEPREIVTQVTTEDPYRPSYYGKAVTGTLTVSAFTTDLADSDTDHWKDCLIEFLTGVNAGSVKPIGAYNPTGGLITLKAGYTLPNAPANNDTFRLITR